MVDEQSSDESLTYANNWVGVVLVMLCLVSFCVAALSGIHLLTSDDDSYKPGVPPGGFTDVSEEQAPEINFAASENLVSGYASRQFKPDAEVSLDSIAVGLANVSGSSHEMVARCVLANLPNRVSAWYYPDMFTDNIRVRTSAAMVKEATRFSGDITRLEFTRSLTECALTDDTTIPAVDVPVYDPQAAKKWERTNLGATITFYTSAAALLASIVSLIVASRIIVKPPKRPE